jgi:hypothetical protein
MPPKAPQKVAVLPKTGAKEETEAPQMRRHGFIISILEIVLYFWGKPIFDFYRAYILLL